MRALAPFFAFAPALRATGLPAAPEQVQSFFAAVGLLGPRSIHDIRRAAHAIFGPAPEPAGAFRQMLRRDGEIATLPTRHRRARQRRVLLLIDVSGSMKAGTDGALRLAHALVQAGERVEVFTVGTRLTRVTRALRHRNRDQALLLASGLVADWDGGTRLGDALQVFLSVPRFASFARGALSIIISDGPERGGPEALVGAMQRLDGLCFATLWLSPLAADPDYRPETGAMRAILPMLDRLADYGWAFDLQVFTGQMPQALRLVDACPGVSFVLQHAGMLEDTSDTGRARWRAAMADLALRPNAVAKLSGFGTFLHRNDPAHIAGLVTETVALFGANRCLWGSNFPIERLWTDCPALLSAHRAACGGPSAADTSAIFNDTAARVYRL